MIRSFRIKNFKSLDISAPLQFGKGLNVLIGLNGSGKSTLLQALSFVSSLGLYGGCGAWLDRRGWVDKDLTCALRFPGITVRRSVIEFEMSAGQAEDIFDWSGIYNTQSRRCTEEELRGHSPEMSLTVKNGRLTGKGILLPDNMLKLLVYEGSVLSALKLPAIQAAQQALFSCHSLELLSPHLMRGRIRRAIGTGVGGGGEQIAHYLKHISPEKRQRLEDIMRRFYPGYESYAVSTMRGGALRFSVQEKFAEGGSLSSDAKQICDGMLRVLAITAQSLECEGKTLLIDEPEDGINPELLERLVAYLRDEAPCQTIITTHQPLVLSCLTDDEARQGVYLVTKNDRGSSDCVRFFDLPTPRDMLKSYYPGEVMLRCNLEEVSREAR